MNANARDRVILAAVIFVVLLAQVLLYPGIADLVAALGATTDLDASMWFLAAEFAAFILCVSLWGALSDRAGRRVPFIAAGALGGALGYLVLALAPAVIDMTFAHVLALRVFQGAATIGAFSLAITMLMDLPGGHGKNMGAAGIAIGLGAALGAPLGGQLSSIGPLVPLVVAGALFCVVVPVVLLVRDRAPASGRPRVGEVFADLAQTPALGIPYAFGFVDRLTAGFFALVGVFYFRETFGLDAAGAGLVLLLFFAPFALLQYPLGILSDRIGRTIPIVVGSILYGTTVIAVGLAPSFDAARLAMVFAGVVGALIAPATMALVTDIAASTRRGTAMAGFNVFGSLGFFTGFLVGGVVAGTYGYPTAFVVVGGMEIAIALLASPLFVRLDLSVDSTVTTD